MGAFTNIFPFHRNIVFPFAPVVVVPSVSQNLLNILISKFLPIEWLLSKFQSNTCIFFIIFLTADRSACLKRRSTWIISLNQNNIYPDNQKQDHFKHCI